eukprot:1156630-Pelagomonas_calceolata.AAC.7
MPLGAAMRHRNRMWSSCTPLSNNTCVKAKREQDGQRGVNTDSSCGPQISSICGFTQHSSRPPLDLFLSCLDG